MQRIGKQRVNLCGDIVFRVILHEFQLGQADQVIANLLDRNLNLCDALQRAKRQDCDVCL